MAGFEHEVAEQRSLRFHAAIAQRVLVDPAILIRTQFRVEGWIRSGEVAAYYAHGWRDILARPVSEIVAFLRSDTERSQAFRQVSPFAGVLSAQERWKLWAAPGSP